MSLNKPWVVIRYNISLGEIRGTVFGNIREEMIEETGGRRKKQWHMWKGFDIVRLILKGPNYILNVENSPQASKGGFISKWH